VAHHERDAAALERLGEGGFLGRAGGPLVVCSAAGKQGQRE
jgi:hypothetical protein